MNRIKHYAFKTFLALSNVHKSVCRVFPNALINITEHSGYYMGIKNVPDIKNSFIQSLESLGYILHTVDKASLGGRGIDIDLKNPLTGQAMTGSSSGTAMNVFLNINDIGIGTDGGGSVLAPALALNVCSCIHGLLGKDAVNEGTVKRSTDGIPFTASLGILSKELSHIQRIIYHQIPLTAESHSHVNIAIDSAIDLPYPKIDITDKYTLSRQALIERLECLLQSYDIIISKEGPVDYHGFGESIFGHFDQGTQTIQQKANKGFIRVANMCHAMAVTVPSTELSTGYVLICRTTNKTVVDTLFKLADQLKAPKDTLVEQYFGRLDQYFTGGKSV
ncbi:hypothetical protein GMA11_04545 [Granulicatella sp. zg-ZJ]|uniref:amidase family protein n=1 Tax=Granulicatella sp. zg-ZJ TaxID=2678504 RepID=UPI0013D7B14D|nr:amidase family protein [Granulicatella sp. zg-ZJ]NEW62658.1 hypothetical protein [Granulicatella sp. zg-ZJ]